MYVLLTGMCGVYVSNEGRETKVASIPGGTVFGQQALQNKEVRNASIVTMEPCQVLML